MNRKMEEAWPEQAGQVDRRLCFVLNARVHCSRPCRAHRELRSRTGSQGEIRTQELLALSPTPPRELVPAKNHAGELGSDLSLV